VPIITRNPLIFMLLFIPILLSLRGFPYL
jgi:hypothetical protein